MVKISQFLEGMPSATPSTGTRWSTNRVHLLVSHADTHMFTISNHGVPEWYGVCLIPLRRSFMGIRSGPPNLDPRRYQAMKKNQKGFSLIELLIVVAIILIIAAIAI